MNQSIKLELDQLIKQYSDVSDAIETFITANMMDESQTWNYIEDEIYKRKQSKEDDSVDKKELLKLEIEYLEGMGINHIYPPLFHLNTDGEKLTTMEKLTKSFAKLKKYNDLNIETHHTKIKDVNEVRDTEGDKE